MNLLDIKILVIENNLTLSKLSNILGIGRRNFYMKIKKNDLETIEK